MLALFTLQLLTGISLMWALMPRRAVTSGFFRIQMLLGLGLCAVIAVAAPALVPRLPTDSQAELTSTPAALTPPAEGSSAASEVRILAILMGSATYLGSIFWTLDRRKPGAILAILVCGLAQLALDFAVRGTLQPNWLGLISAGVTASVLGGAVTAMLLGHWYLTAPTMSIAPLSRLTCILFISLLLRILVSGWCWYTGADALQSSLLWTWWSLRWLAGIVAPLILCGMTFQILRYRNTQAATGVLFALVILSFIGELSAMLLSVELRRPY